MAESPALLRGFLALRELYATTGFSAGEVQVLSLTAAHENDCAWCVAFHTAMALKEGVDRDAVDALRQGAGAHRPPPWTPQQLRARDGAQPRAYRRSDVARVPRRRVSKRQALDVVMGMAFSLMANYAGHLTNPPLDDFSNARLDALSDVPHEPRRGTSARLIGRFTTFLR